MELLDQIWGWAAAYAGDVLASPRQMVAHGFAALGVVLAAVAALVRTMVPLRWLAVGSNLAQVASILLLAPALLAPLVAVGLLAVSFVLP